MKKLFVSLSLLVAAGQAHAIPGRWGLTCITAKGTSKEIRINATAFDIEGEHNGLPSEVNLKYPKNVYGAKNDDGTLKNLINVNHAVDKVLSVKYFDDNIDFNIWALPDSIRLDKDTTELEGHLTFRAKGWVRAGAEGYKRAKFECSYNYDSGSAG